jgi:hypothetical protein
MTDYSIVAQRGASNNRHARVPEMLEGHCEHVAIASRLAVSVDTVNRALSALRIVGLSDHGASQPRTPLRPLAFASFGSRVGIPKTFASSSRSIGSRFRMAITGDARFSRTGDTTRDQDISCRHHTAISAESGDIPGADRIRQPQT